MDILNSALNGQEVGETRSEETQADVTQATGEETAASPAEQQEHQKEEPQDQAKGLQAALLAERRRRQELERIVAERQEQRPAQQEKSQDGAPDPANYQDNPQQYWRDLARHEARQELKAAEEQRQQREAEATINRRMAETRDRLNAAVVQGQQKYRDFDAVINGNLAPFLNDHMREEIAASDVGADVAYWLGKNPAEAQRLSGLTDRALAREFARLEMKVSAPAKAALPQTLTQTRDARGQFAEARYDGPTPLDAVLGRKT